MPPQVSILIPTLNGADLLGRLLAEVAAQDTELGFEVVAVDSGSSDDTLRLLDAAGARTIQIEPGTFNHGATRNLGIEQCRGERIVLLVQDAVPASTSWLSTLVRPLDTDARVAGSFARQLPHPEASALTRYNLAQWVAAGPQRRVSSIPNAEALSALTPAQRHELCAFDNVCSCIRRSVWEEHPFPEVEIAEDLAWSKQVLLAGHQLVYEPQATVYHSHERALRYELKRTCLVHRQLGRLFGLRTIPSATALARAVALSFAVHLRCLFAAHRMLPPLLPLWRATALSVLWPLGQYLGGRAFARGHGRREPAGR